MGAWLLAAVGCAAGRPLPLPSTTSPPPVQLLHLTPVQVTEDTLELDLVQDGVGPVQLFLDGQPLLGCAPAAAPDAAAAHLVRRRCRVAGVSPGTHRLLATALAPADGVGSSLEARGLGLRAPGPRARAAEPPGSWWWPGGWDLGTDVPPGGALATWVSVGPRLPADDLRCLGGPPASLLDERTGQAAAALEPLPPCPAADALAAPLSGFFAGARPAEDLLAVLVTWHASAAAAGAAGCDQGPLPPADDGDGRLVRALRLALAGVPGVYCARLPAGESGRLRALLAARRAHPALSRGRFVPLAGQGGLLAFLRVLPATPGPTVADLALVVVNREAGEQLLDVALPGELTRSEPLRSAWDGADLPRQEGRLRLAVPPRSVSWYVAGRP